jgi:hypothetical protein
MTHAPEGSDAASLRAVARAHERINRRARELEHSGRARKAHSGLDLRLYDSGLTVELYLEGTSESGAGRCWWLEAVEQLDGTWVLEAALLTNDGGAQQTVAALPDLHVDSTSALTRVLDLHVQKLLMLGGESAFE